MDPSTSPVESAGSTFLPPANRGLPQSAADEELHTNRAPI
jgi:hypothetical protein